jgi:myo-inositol 2-dehydrogenase / D-chiro-inositol 1-dehydrogenase
MNNPIPPTNTPAATLNRRRFLVGAGAATAAFSLMPAHLVAGTEANSRIKLGLIGCGGRGQWIADLFGQHGGFELAAVADYFPARTEAAAAKFHLRPEHCYNGLGAYRWLLSESLDAVAIETPPYFHAEQAAAAVAAGKHVYLAKPVAVDVPGCRTVEASGRKASQQQLCFQVDFQTRANASYQEAVRRVHQGMIGRIVSADAAYHCGPTWGGMDAFLRKEPNNPEARLRAWGLDRVLSGDVITEQNIHALDVATWFLDAAPIKATGSGGKARPFLGDCWDHFAVVYHFPGDVLVSFSSTQVGAGYDDILCRVYGTEGTADTHYFGEVWVHSKEDGFNGGRMTNLYTEGVVANIANFHRCITLGDHTNPTVAPSVRSNLTAILGRTAAYRNAEVTWDHMMRANDHWSFKPKGLKA